MAQRLDLRKLVATAGERLKVGDAVLRRILNHTAPKSDGLHSAYVSLDVGDMKDSLVLIHAEFGRLMGL